MIPRPFFKAPLKASVIAACPYDELSIVVVDLVLDEIVAGGGTAVGIIGHSEQVHLIQPDGTVAESTTIVQR
jgi:hypothetical protein